MILTYLICLDMYQIRSLCLIFLIIFLIVTLWFDL